MQCKLEPCREIGGATIHEASILPESGRVDISQ